MRVAMFYHSLVSDWNHGNAHFLRGVVTELLARGHQVDVYEPEDSWSVKSLLESEGPWPIEGFYQAYPQLQTQTYDLETVKLNRLLDGVDLVLVHEWNPPELIARIGDHRARRGRYVLLFHDTHHRAMTQPEEMARYELSGYDGALVFGEVLQRIYLERGWVRDAFVWHEAADTRVFAPLDADLEGDLVWVGNWGDEERTAELHEFLLEPVRELGLRATVYGVRYPNDGLAALAEAGIRYGGYLPNYLVPDVLARHRLTIHVPRRPYVEALPGIPTIRVFESLACGKPLICAPWDDREHLFTPGRDYLQVRDGEEMKAALETVLDEPRRAAELSRQGRATIEARHTCGHRVDELLAITRRLRAERQRRSLAWLARGAD